MKRRASKAASFWSGADMTIGRAVGGAVMGLLGFVLLIAMAAVLTGCAAGPCRGWVSRPDGSSCRLCEAGGELWRECGQPVMVLPVPPR